MLPQSAKDLEDQLWRIAVSRGVIAPNCEQQLRSLIWHGVEEIVAQHLLNDKEKIDLAKGNLVQLLNKMMHHQVGFGMTELHEPTLNAALNDLCPLWPFCDEQSARGRSNQGSI